MTSFTFTAEQLRLAPPEVRRWAVQEIAQALAAAERPSHDPSQVKAAALAACTEEEALQLFTMIRSNFVIAQVFFELARDAAPGARVPPLHPLNAGDILRHTRLAHSDGLLECFNVINEAFRQIHGDSEASLFGFDGHGHVYIHDATHLSIRRLFEQLVRPVPPATSGAVPTETPSAVQTPRRATPAVTPVANRPPREPAPSVRKGPPGANAQMSKPDQSSTSLRASKVGPPPAPRHRVRKAPPVTPSLKKGQKTNPEFKPGLAGKMGEH